jgi:tripartite-type tricarboxylate transporter receptor subunit TctC
MKRIFKRMPSLAGLVAAMALCAAIPGNTQTYPTKTITIVVPLAAGTAMDSLARFYGEELQKSLGQPVIIANQPGAGLRLAAQTVARAEPDGYTLLVNSAPVMAVNQSLFKKLEYDAEKDFAPIAIYAKSPFLLIVNPASKVGTVKDFIAQAKEKSPALQNYATPGVGTLQFLAMEALKRQFGFEIDHVPYRTSPQILTDIMGANLATSIYEAGGAIPLVRDNKLRALAVTSLVRHHDLPDVPTLAEAANIKDFEAVSWHVLLAPSKTPPAILEKLSAEMRRIALTDAFQARVRQLGLMPVAPTGSTETNAYILAERVRWSEIVRALGLEGSQ